MEVIALPYSERTDELTAQELSASEKQSALAFNRAVKSFNETLLMEIAMVQQGPRGTLLTGFRRDDVIQRLLPCGGQRFTVRRCASTTDAEASEFASFLSLVLQDAKWANNLSKVVPYVDPGNCFSEGVGVNVKAESSQGAHKCGRDLVSALIMDSITGVRFDDKGRFDIIPRDGPNVPYDARAILVDVFQHPLARFPDKLAKPK